MSTSTIVYFSVVSVLGFAVGFLLAEVQKLRRKLRDEERVNKILMENRKTL